MRIDFSNPGAFAPFYDHKVGVKGLGTFRACIFENGLDDPLADESFSERRKLCVHIPKRGLDAWNATEQPKVGSILTILEWGGIEENACFSVSGVMDFGDAWVLDAREVSHDRA